jgi:hypothetical protein
MKLAALVLTVGLVLRATDAPAQSPARASWDALQAKRAELTGLHQEFEIEQTITFAGGDKRATPGPPSSTASTCSKSTARKR